MSKKILSAVVVAVVLLGGIFYYYKISAGSGAQKTQPAQSQPAQSQPKVDPVATKPVATKEVSYGADGFSPKFISVKLGDTVTFTNQSNVGMWVASAPHPAHTIYPEFDAKKAYNMGEAYTFTFTKAGTWKFHNHLKSTDFGSVTVE